MAIATSVNSSYFVLDVPDVRWTGAAAGEGKNVRVTITPENGAQVQFTEAYSPDEDGAITLRGLAELLQPYVKPCPTPLREDLLRSSGVWLATVTRASWTAQLFTEPDEGDPTTVSPTFHSYAYYASQRTNASPGETGIWLTRYTERSMVPTQPIVLSAFLTSSLSVQVRVTYETAAGTLAQTSFAPTLGNGAANPPAYAAVLHYTLSGIASAAHVDADSIHIVTVELRRNSTAIDSVTFHIDRTHKTQQRLVAFTNCYGMLETEALIGSNDRTTAMEAEYSWIDREYEKTSQEEITTEHLCAGSISEQQRSSLRDLAVSPEVYIFEEDGSSCFDKVTVTGIEMTDRRPRSAPQTAYIDLRRSHRHQEVVNRTGDTDSGGERHRIFDYTFDSTYN